MGCRIYNVLGDNCDKHMLVHIESFFGLFALAVHEQLFDKLADNLQVERPHIVRDAFVVETTKQ